MNRAGSTQSFATAARARIIALMLAAVAALSAMHAGSVRAAMAPANSVIGNQASATYVDNTATTRTSTSNTVQTTVAERTSRLVLQRQRGIR